MTTNNKVVLMLLLSSWWTIINSEPTLPWSDTTNQGFTPAVDDDPDHNVEKRYVRTELNQYETLAQMTCTSMAIKKGVNGWIYAVRRECKTYNRATCNRICTNPYMTREDHQTRHRKWQAIGGVRIYTQRPASVPPSTPENPSIGLKVLVYPFQDSCGPNFCCCFVAY